MTAAPGRAAPVASYRLQLTPEHDLDHAAELLDHLAALGVSHVYLSPVGEAVPGSQHGYDVVDHTRVRAELGGAAALDRLLDAAAARGLRVVIDHVPNHASTARPELNRPWWEMLRDGPGSPAAAWFDVDRTADDRVVLPVLGEPLDEVLAAGGITVADPDDVVAEPHLVVHGGLRLPLAGGDASGELVEVLERQHYRLQHWRDPERNVRRFFTIDDLVAVRAEDPTVAATIDVVPAGLAGHPGFGGVRVDHVDGLADPGSYLAGLRGRIGADAWLVVEKIVAPDETLVASWTVDGTTGYEFARALDHVMVVPDAAATFDRFWRDAVDAVGDPRVTTDFATAEEIARREVLDEGLLPDLERTVRAVVPALGPDVDTDAVRAVITAVTVGLPRYRTYLPDDPAGADVLRRVAGDAKAALADPATGGPAGASAELVDAFVAMVLEPVDEAQRRGRTRWQQVTGPAMAKGAEDRAFYRYLRFAALCEVGGEPGRFGSSVADFHAAQLLALATHPLTMLAASTHDTKRSADVRARAAALTAEHEAWADAVGEWLPALAAAVPGIRPTTHLHALQTVVCCPGLDADRLTAFLVKSAREAELRTAWTDADEDHERRLGELAEVLVGDPARAGSIAESVAVWAERLDRPGWAAAIGATLARCTAPGVPDTYQGTEVFSYRLVDPDNRVPPDWAAVRATVRLAAGFDLPAAWHEHPDAAKAVVMARAAALRRRHPDAFGVDGTYAPVTVTGPGAERVLAFERGGVAATVIALPGLDAVDPDGATTLDLPAGEWRDALDDGADPVSGTVAVADLLARAPAALLERTG